MKDQEQRRYPIGKFEYGRTYSMEEIRGYIQVLSRLPKELKKTLQKLRPHELDIPYRKDGWTVRQVVHHLADSHLNAYVRMKLCVTEHTPIIKPYDETAWAELEDGRSAPVKLSLRLLNTLHRRWVRFMEHLTEEDLQKGYYHPETKRAISLPESIALYCWHSKHHLAHIRLVVDAVTHSEDKMPDTLRPSKRGRKHKEVEVAAPATPPAPAAPAPAAPVAAPAAPVAAPATAPAVTIHPEQQKTSKRNRRSKEEMAAFRAQQAAEQAEREASGEPRRRGRTPEEMARVREARMAKLAEKRAQLGIVAKERETPKRKRRTKEEMAAFRAQQEAERATGEPRRRGRSPEDMARIREIRMARLAERRAALGIVVPEKEGPKRKRRTKEEMAAFRIQQAAEKAEREASGEPRRRGRSPEDMARIREIRMAKLAERRAEMGITVPQNDRPKRKRRTKEEMEQFRIQQAAERSARIAAGDPPRRGRSAEDMARMREVRMARLEEKRKQKATNSTPKETGSMVISTPKKRGSSPEQMPGVREKRRTKQTVDSTNNDKEA